MRAIDLALAALALAIAAGCTARLDAADWQTRLESRDSGEAASARDGDGSWREGVLLTHSALRYGIRRIRSSASSRAEERWTLEIHGPASAFAGSSRAAITVTTSAGVTSYRSHQWNAALAVARGVGETRREETRLALGFVGADLWSACARSRELLDEGVREVDGSEAADLRGSLSRGAAACLFMGRTLASSAELRRLASRFVQWPGLLSLLRLRVEASISPYFERVRRVETAFGPGLALPIELEVNGDQAFVGEFHIVEPRGALLLVAGIVAIEGLAPDRPDERLRIELVGPVPHESVEAGETPSRRGIVPALQRTRELAR